MKVAVSSNGDHLDAEVSMVFGRCTCFMLVDTDTMEAIALPNPAINASGGAGIASAQFIVQQGAQAVLSNNIGPNAMQVLQAAGITVYTVGSCTVRQAVQALRDGDLQTGGQPAVPSDFGKPAGGQRGMGMGRGGGRGVGGGGRGAGGFGGGRGA